ncbi:MAG: thioredoxin domain-containing protein [Nakamurella sp.]
MTNRLSGARSTYLLQHKDNPVDWWEWGAEAFAEARRRNVPVLLSVGYASCHWCHVMARESFEDEGTAAAVNQDFVSIKVDREERPDIDAIYMAATQAMTGSGGWPMTCFLTPEGEPFYAGTYYPRAPRGGMPSFQQVLAAVTEAWRRDPTQVREASGRIAQHLQTGMTGQPSGAMESAALDTARDQLLAQIDRVNGGFGTAPKFPPTMVLEFLMRNYERTAHVPALDAVTLSLERMARGGIYDQLAGGFARYSVDSEWHTPHFEKMLDDNAQLLRVYAHHARLTGSLLTERIARETGGFIVRELAAEGGGFIASLSADSAGVEGLTYRWPLAELTVAIHRVVTAKAEFLEPTDMDDAVQSVLVSLGVDSGRPDPEGEILRLVSDPADPALFDEVRRELGGIRANRPQPGRDEIVTLRSNGLAITALAEAGALLGRSDWVDAATVAAEMFEAQCRTETGWLRSVFRGRVSSAPAGLADYASISAGLAALYQATGEPRHLTLATETLGEMTSRFRSADGTWFDAAAATESHGPNDPLSSAAPMIVRPRDPTDGASPSGLSAAADALVTVSALMGDAALRASAEEIAATVTELAAQFPRSAGWHLAVAQALKSGPLQVAVAGPRGAARDELAAVARRSMPGGAVIDVGIGDEPGRPLLEARTGLGAAPAAYVCRGFVCDRPTASGADLERLLHEESVIPDPAS